jgi:acetyl esterase/lipase
MYAENLKIMNSTKWNWVLACALAAVTLASVEARPLRAEGEIVLEKGVEYANPDNQHLQLDIARPDGAGPYPAVIYIHGGGFVKGTRESDRLIKKLAENGYVAVTITYRLTPQYQFPAAVNDSKAAVRWLRANAAKYRVDPERIGATGASAGGNLAQFLGVTADLKQFEGDGGNADRSSRVACVVNICGPVDFPRWYAESADAAKYAPPYLGGNLEQSRQRHIQASPFYWVTPDSAPTLCIHGTKDNQVGFEQSQWIVERLKSAGVEAELLSMEGAGHGFKGEVNEKAEAAMLAFFDAHLKK